MRRVYRLIANLACITWLVSPAAADPEPKESQATARIGDLILDYDASRFTVRPVGDRIVIECRDEHRYECRDAFVIIRIVRDIGPESCSPEAMLGHFGLGMDDVDVGIGKGSIWQITPNGLDLHAASIDIGCRNAAGGPVFACTRYAGRTYLFDAPGAACRTPYGHASAVVHLLSGVHPR